MIESTKLDEKMKSKAKELLMNNSYIEFFAMKDLGNIKDIFNAYKNLPNLQIALRQANNDIKTLED